MNRIALIAFISLSLLDVRAEKQVVSPQGAAMDLPFSPGILAGDFLYISGAVGNLPGTSDFPKAIEEQTRQTLRNLGDVLRAGGLDFSDVVSSNVYLADIRYFPQMNEAYREFFPAAPPARATVEGDVVVRDGLVEISLIAARKEVSKRVVTPSGWPTPRSPYSWAVLAADTLFISGLVGSDPGTGKYPEDFKSQTEQAFRNMQGILETAGFSFKDLAATRVYLVDSRDFAQMNEIYRRFLLEDPPVRATVQARLGDPKLLVEIQAVAVRSGKETIGERGPSHFSPAVRVGQRLFLSGMVGRGPSGFAAGDLKAQARQTLLNLRETLERAGMGLGDVVEATVFLADVRHFQAMNEVYAELMPEPRPARATVGTGLMSSEALIEIMMTATKE